MQTHFFNACVQNIQGWELSRLGNDQWLEMSGVGKVQWETAGVGNVWVENKVVGIFQVGSIILVGNVRV